MILQNAVTDIPLGAFLAGLIRTFHTEGAYGQTQAYIERHTGLSTIRFHFETFHDIYPKWIAWESLEWGIVAVDGIENARQGIHYWNAFAPRIGLTVFPDTNNDAETFYENTPNKDKILSARSAPNLILCGHSYGGAIAQVLGKQLNRIIPTDTTKIITFGQPKVMKASELRKIDYAPKCRWMLQDDLVPLVPIGGGLEALALQTLAWPVFANYARFVHSAGGLRIDRDNVVREAIEPLRSDGLPSLSVGSWWFETQAAPDSRHNIGAYTDRMNELSLVALNPPTVAVPVAPEQPTPDLPRRAAERVRETINANVSQQAAYQQAIPYQTESDVVFKKVKVNGLWYCAFGKELISCGPTRRKAGRMAQAGNLFLRRLQREGLVDPNAVVTQFQDWLASASDPASGIRPTLLISR